MVGEIGDRVVRGPVVIEDPLIGELAKAGLPNSLLNEVRERLRDHLTGLPKAETCQNIVDQLIQSERRVTIEFDDLRFLKIFNKIIGPEKTNDLLRTVGRVYQKQAEALREQGMEVVVGRYAGDSFLIILPDLSSEEATKIFDGFHAELKKIPQPEGAPFKPHFSRGVASSEELAPKEQRNYRMLIELADRRAEETKENKWEQIQKRGKTNPPTRRFVRAIKRYG